MIESLEKELEKKNEELVKKENDVNDLSQKLAERESKEFEGNSTEETSFIKISKGELPSLWRDYDVQLWTIVRDTSFAEENNWDLGVTNWLEWKGHFDQELTFESPGEIMNAWVKDVSDIYWLGQELWEISMRNEYIDENHAVGYILRYGFLDDSIAGDDVKLTMVRENDTWSIKKVEMRHHCSRYVNDEKELCV